jgi:hypothetical protein
MQIIPFKEPAQWREQIELTGTNYILRFKWNAINQFWSMDVLDIDDNPIVLGVKVVVNWNLLEQYSMLEKPQGDILCQNIVGGFQKLGRFDMSEIAELLYYEPGELSELEAST